MTWIFLTLILPIILGILFAFAIKSKFINDLGKFFLPLLIISSIIGYGFNKNYWGYIIKRPSVFSELKNSTEILSITRASKTFDKNKYQISRDTVEFKKFGYFLDLYYKDFERPFMQFEALGYIGNLPSYKKIVNNQKLKLTDKELREINDLIVKSSFLEKPENGYEEYGNNLSIQVIEFATNPEVDYLISENIENIENPLFEYDDKYFFVTVKSGQLSNDHYPIYEFLIEKGKIVKQQKYFYDVAGIEGAEYSRLAPIAEGLILILSIILFGIYKLVFWLRKNWLQHRIKTIGQL